MQSCKPLCWDIETFWKKADQSFRYRKEKKQERKREGEKDLGAT